MKLGSLFDGSGTCPLAASAVGITPAWASEVEPYPVAVTRSRFPNMTHLGSVTDIHGGDIEPVDIITFGSPCQDLSVAGKRAGLKHEANGDEETTRSGLFMEAVRIIKEMREATNGEYPTFAVWENVPGAFSSNKGEDFRTVLEELIKIVEPTVVMPAVPKNGWAYADSYCGDGWSLAYRVLDAQYWGVPQRRRRIYLVLDLRGQCAREVLFERESLRRDFAESGTPWQGTAGDAANCSGTDDCEGECVAYSFDSLASNSMKSKNPYSGCRRVEIAKTLDTTDPNPCKNQGGIAIVEPVPYTPKIRSGCEGGGKGALIQEDKSATLNTIDRPAVSYDAVSLLGDKVAGTLMARDYKGIGRHDTLGSAVCIPMATHYIVRRLTPTECARLQGFLDDWGHPDHKDDFTDEEYRFWLNVRNTHAAINGKPQKDYTKAQMLAWYNKLHTDSSEYKMWGNGMAFPCMLYIMEGVQEVLTERYLKNLFGGDTSDR